MHLLILLLIQLEKEHIIIIQKGRSKKGNHIMPKVDVEEVTTVHTVSPQGPQGRAWGEEKHSLEHSELCGMDGTGWDGLLSLNKMPIRVTAEQC